MQDYCVNLFYLGQCNIEKLNDIMTKLPPPTRFDEMSLLLDCLRAFLLLFGQMSERLKPLLRKNLSKLKAPEKELLSSTRSICSLFGALNEFKLDSIPNSTQHDDDCLESYRYLNNLKI